MSKFTPEQEERLKNFTDEQKKVLKESLRGLYGITGAKMDKFMNLTENKPFNEKQMQVIADGIDYRFPAEMYAKPEFNFRQMRRIYDGFKMGLSAEQISIFAKPEFDSGQMYEIEYALHDGLSAEQINVFAKPEFDDTQMAAIISGFKINLSAEQIALYAKPEIDGNRMDVIKNGFRRGFSMEQINPYINPEFNDAQMGEIADAFFSDFSIEEINMFAKPEFSNNLMHEIKDGFEEGLSAEQISLYANPEFNSKQINDIKQGLKEGLSMEQIAVYAKPEFNEDQKREKGANQKVILAPSYEIAKTIKAEATVEAEYGDECLEGTMTTLAHHGLRSNNPAPCNTPNVPKLPSFATIVVSHIDLDTLGGIYALQGKKPDDDRFWEAAEMIDVKGAHHIHELDQDIQDKLNAYYAYNDEQPKQRYTEAIDVTKQIDNTYNVVKAIVDINDPEHDKLIAAGKEWAQTREKEVEDKLVYENKDVRVFDTNGIFCAASYFSPNQNTICPATITYNEKFKSITLAFEDGGKQLNAREIVQELWGPEAGGREGIAGSPRNVEMTKDDLAKLVNEVTEKQLKLETEIEPHQYEGNWMLNSLSIPDNIEKIGNNAFKDCSNLSELLINDELLAKTDIESAFANTNLDLDTMREIANEYRDQEFDISDEDNSTENENFGEL